MIEAIVANGVTTRIEGTDIQVTYEKDGLSRIDRLRDDGVPLESNQVPIIGGIALSQDPPHRSRPLVVTIRPNPDPELDTATVTVEPANRHQMQLQQGTKEGRLTGYCRAWCSCGEFDLNGRAVVVAAAILQHNGQPSGTPTAVHLVIMDRSGLFGCFFDEDLAHQTAQAIGGVIATVPVVADYRGLSKATVVEGPLTEGDMAR